MIEKKGKTGTIHLTKEEEQKRTTVYNLGLTDRESAKKLNIKPETFKHWRVRRNLKANFPKHRRTKLTPEIKKRFKEIWQTHTYKEITKELGISVMSIHKLKVELKLPKKMKLHKCQYDYPKVEETLKKNNGYLKRKDVHKLAKVSTYCVEQMIKNRLLIYVNFNLGRSSGSYKRNNDDDVFNKGYFKEGYVCLDKTGLVRLMAKAMKKPNSKGTANIQTKFLKKHLTEAERLAVQIMMGKKKISNKNFQSKLLIGGKKLKQQLVPVKSYLEGGKQN